MQPLVNAKSFQKTKIQETIWCELGNGDPMHEACIPHTIRRAGNSKDEESQKKNTRIIIKK